MAKTLILIRHGKAEDESKSRKDIYRKLSAKGIKQANFIGQHLRIAQIHIDTCFYSTARRTTETFELVKNVMNKQISASFSEPKLYLCDRDYFFDFIAREAKDTDDTIAIIGHNNGLSDFLSAISSSVMYINLSTCETAILELDITNWQEIFEAQPATIVNIIKPKI